MTESADGVEQSHESGDGAVPNPETGAGIGAGHTENTFEPEEDPDSVEDPDTGR